MENEIYLDNNATTACSHKVVEAMLPFLAAEFGNASSPHAMGRRASLAVARARDQVAACVGCASSEVFFTSGATESNNIALLGLQAGKSRRRTIVTTAIEHKSVLSACEQLKERGYSIVHLSVDHQGHLDEHNVIQAIDDNVLLISIQGANNEVGAIQPIKEITRAAHSSGAMVHCDAAQLLGKVKCDVNELDVDFASFSAHKAYGPKGIGALYISKKGQRGVLHPILFGGMQEGGIRPGTLNVPGIVGFGVACALVDERLESDMERIRTLRDTFAKALLDGIPSSRINGPTEASLPGTISLTIPGLPASLLIANTERICLGVGSACNWGAPEPSHVLLAMGLSRSDADSTVRISLGRKNSISEINEAATVIISESKRLLDLISDTHN